MFHVERSLQKRSMKGTIVILFLFFVIYGCGISRVTTVISDYILIPSNGKNVIGRENLTAFLFENNLKNLSIEQFLLDKFKFDNYQTREFWVTIDGTQFYIMVYDKSETEKYFDLSVFSLKNVEPDTVRIEGQSQFIAISVINAYNEDCLADDSLYQNVVVNYLKKLKDEYYNY